MNEDFTGKENYYQECRDFDTNENGTKPGNIKCLRDHKMSDCRQSLSNCVSMPKCHESCLYCYKGDDDQACIGCSNEKEYLYKSKCHQESLDSMNVVSQIFVKPENTEETITINLCIPKTDYSTEDNPYKVYVTTPDSESNPDPASFKSLYTSLYKALSNVYGKYTTIYLLKGKTDHIIEGFSDDFISLMQGYLDSDFLYYYFEDQDDEITRKINIEPYRCSDESFCYKNGERATIKWERSVTESEALIKVPTRVELTISEVNFWAEEYLVNDCYVLDKGEEEVCEEFPLFSIEGSGSLNLNNVKIRDWRARIQSIIYIELDDDETPVLSMNNVDFESVMASLQSENSAIIFIDDKRVDSGHAGKISYQGGTVSNLYPYGENNDIQDNLSFIFALKLQELTLQDIKFQNITAYNDSEMGYGLIYLEDIKNLTVTSCTFEYNIVSQTIFEIEIGSNYVRDSLDHITFKDNTFYSNFGSLFVLSIEDEYPNIKFTSNNFTKSYLNDKADGVIQIYASPSSSDSEEANSSSFIFEDNNFAYCYVKNNLMTLDNLLDIKIENLNIQNSLNNRDSSYKYLGEEIYGVDNHQDYAIRIENTRSLNITSLNLLDNYSPDGCTGISIDGITEYLYVTTATIQNNECNCKDSMGISVSSSYGLTRIKNIQANNNRNTSPEALGIISVISYDQPATLTFEDSDFISIFSYGVSGAYLKVDSITLKNLTFKNNSIQKVNTAALYIDPPAKNDKIQVTISNTSFESNSNSIGGAAALYITNTEETQKQILLSISNCTFKSNTSKTDGAALVLTSKLVFDNSSEIRNCTFISNISDIKGNLKIEHSSNTLTFRECIFKDNISKQGTALYISLADSQVRLIDSNFTSNNSTSKISGTVITFTGNSRKATLISSGCHLSYHNSTVISILSGKWNDSGSTFEYNSAFKASVLNANVESNVIMNDSTISSNRATKSGGVFILSGLSSILLQYCTASDNESKENGGVFSIEQGSSLIIKDSHFLHNSARQKGSVIYAIGCNIFLSEIISSTFRDNISGEGGTIMLVSSILNVSNSFIESNYEDKEIGINGIYAILSVIDLYNTTFYDQYGSYGGSLHLSTESALNMNYCKFIHGGAKSQGGAIYAQQSSNITIYNSIFEDLTAQTAAGIYLYTESNLSIINSTFTNIHVTGRLGGSIIDTAKSTVLISGCRFDNFTGTGIYGVTIESLEINYSNFANGDGSGMQGGAVSCKQCEILRFFMSNFTENKSDYGGAIYISNTADNLVTRVAQVMNCSFIGNSASYGGGIFTSNLNITIANSYFWNNSAIGKYENTGVGGAIAVKCPDVSESVCEFVIEKNHFKGNSADRNGGGISWLNFEPELNTNLFEENNAIYGPDYACLPSGLAYIDEDSKIYLPTKQRYLQEVPTLYDYAPGQIVTKILTMAVIDIYGQIVVTDTEVSVTLNVDKPASISGDTRVNQAMNGFFNFTGFKIESKPGSVAMVHATADGLGTGLHDSSNTKISEPFELIINLRECEMGEMYSDTACTVCEYGKYSINPTDLICNECPIEAVCYGSYIMTPKPGYWRKDQYTDTFYECPNTVACIGSSSNTSYSGECATGYTGNLCQSCEEGYSRTSKNECGSCPDPTSNGLKLAGILVGVVIVGVVMVKTTMDSAYKQKSLQSIYIKIFFNYLQLVMLTASFELDWPEYVLELFSAQEKAGTATDQIFSVDCFISSRQSSEFSPEDVYYIKLIIMLALPILIFIISLTVWSCISFYYRNLKYFKSEFWATLVILLFLVHPNIVKATFSAFSCMEIEGESWLREDLQIRCWDDRHSLYVVSVALPGIILWGLGIPTVCLFYLYINRRNLDNISVRLKFGFLFNGFKKSRFHWEFVILYRKIIIIFCSVFLSNLSVSVQALTVMIVLLISLHIQNVYQPYNHESLNQMEVRSILVAALTIYCGLYYLTGDLSQIAKLSFFIIIVVSNAYFLYYWILKLLEASSSVLISKIPCLRRRFSKSILDGFSEKMFIKESKNQNIISKEGDVIFSLCPKPHEIFSKPIDPQSYELLNLSATKDLYLEIVRLKNIQQALRPKLDLNNISLTTNPNSLFDISELTEVDLEAPVSLSPRHRSMFTTSFYDSIQKKNDSVPILYSIS